MKGSVGGEGRGWEGMGGEGRRDPTSTHNHYGVALRACNCVDGDMSECSINISARANLFCRYLISCNI